MKKLFILALAASAMLASCSGNQQKAETTEEAEKTFEQQQIEAYIKVQVDSLANEFAKMGRSPFIAALKEGRIELTEEEKQVKPEYLIDPASTNDLVTLSQKYRAVAVLSADKIIAEAYGMPVDEYDAAIKKLIVDIDDPAFKLFKENDDNGTDHKQLVEDFYNAEDENGRINFFWDTTTAFLVEELYIISQDPSNKFIECFDDQAADNVTYRIILFQNALENLKEYDPSLESLCTSIKPLGKLNAITAEQFKQQVGEMNKDIKVLRDNLMK